MSSYLHKGALLIIASTTLFSSHAFAGVSSLIATAGHTDFAYSTASQTLYISGTEFLQRYDMSSKQFLEPIYMGGNTHGMDISADGRYLAVANTARSATQNFVDIIDLTNNTSQRVGFDLGFYESGTFTAAFDGHHGLLVSSSFNGSGWVPLRRYDLETEQTTVLAGVRQDSMLTASADRSVIAVVESNSSNGPWGLYQSGENSYTASGATGWFTYEVGVSRDGSQVAIPTYGGTLIDDENAIIPTIGQYAGGQPIGVAYSPLADLVYFPWAQSSYVYAYDTETGRRLAGYDFEEWFSGTGNHAFGNGRTKVASDGSYLFVSTASGVRYMNIAEVPEPQSYILMGIGLIGLAALTRKRTRIS